MITYWNGEGCGRSSPGSMRSSSDGIALRPSRSSAARSCVLPGRSAGSSVATAKVSSLMFTPSRDEVDDGEDHDPHDVDEVPVETGDLDDLGLLLGDAALLRQPHQRQQHDDP